MSRLFSGWAQERLFNLQRRFQQADDEIGNFVGRSPARWSVGRKIAVITLAVISVGLPINDLWSYGSLVVVGALAFTGIVTAQPTRWICASALVAAAVLGELLVAAPKIDEGENLFIIDKPGGALEQQLPPRAFQIMLAEFNEHHPLAKRCPATDRNICWVGGPFPERAYAFSADGLYQHPSMSRRVTGIDFADPLWLRLGFINELYNWYEGHSDIQRREHRPEDLLHPWRILMPWYVAYQFPKDFTGSRLCWRGEVLWGGENGSFTKIIHAQEACRVLQAADIGRLVFGVAIKNDPPLAMTLHSPLSVRMRGLAERGLAFVGMLTPLLILVRIRWRRTILPLGLMTIGAVAVFLQDSSFFGGFAPQGGGGDGLYYEALGRRIAENLVDGRFAAALSGGVSVFYANPGMSYVRALSRFAVGDTNFVYATLLVTLPLLSYAIWRRFLPARWALVSSVLLGLCPAVTALFVFVSPQVIAFAVVASIVVAFAWAGALSRGWAIVIGACYVVLAAASPFSGKVAEIVARVAEKIAFLLTALADTYSLDMSRWTANAMEGFGDAAGFILFMIGYLLLVRKPIDSKETHFGEAFSAALLLMIGVAVRPPLAVMAAVLLGGAGLACIYWRQYARLAGLSTGFLPILLIPFHNWYFGGVFVPLSANAAVTVVLTPAVIAGALHELAHLRLLGPNVKTILAQVLIFLSARGRPAKIFGFAVLFVAAASRRFDPWLRLTALALITQAFVSLFFLLDRRYFILNWYLTGLVFAAWLHQPETRALIAGAWSSLTGRLRAPKRL